MITQGERRRSTCLNDSQAGLKIRKLLLQIIHFRGHLSTNVSSNLVALQDTSRALCTFGRHGGACTCKLRRAPELAAPDVRRRHAPTCIKQRGRGTQGSERVAMAAVESLSPSDKSNLDRVLRPHLRLDSQLSDAGAEGGIGFSPGTGQRWCTYTCRHSRGRSVLARNTHALTRSSRRKATRVPICAQHVRMY